MIKGGRGEKPKPKVLQPDDWDGRLLAEKKYLRLYSTMTRAWT